MWLWWDIRFNIFKFNYELTLNIRGSGEMLDPTSMSLATC
jgi:hypothetical protein